MSKSTKTTKRAPAKLVGEAGKQVRLAIIAADFNKAIVTPMIESAMKTAIELGCSVDLVLSVPGSFEIPIVLDTVLQRKTVDAAVVLGYIEKGQTLHGEVMGHVVYKAILDLQLMYGKPVGFGIIGPGATLDQAKKRNKAYGEAAVAAAVRTLACLDEAQK